MPNATITEWGKCLPPAVLSNHDLETFMDTSDEWISTRTGIKERRISHVDTSDLAAVAVSRALAAAGRTAPDVDMLLLATCTPDSLIPSAAAHVHRKVGMTTGPAMDVNAACSGFIYGLVTGAKLIESGMYRTVVVVGAEKLSYDLDFTNRNTAVLFGDGAGAVVLEATDEPVGLLSAELGLDSSAIDLLEIPRDGTAGRREHIPAQLCGIQMNGREVFRRAVTTMGDASVRVVGSAGLDLDDVDLLVPHQANVRIIDATAKRLGLDDAKVFVDIGSYGNTSAATIPIALTEALEEGRIRPGDAVVFAAFGAGLTWSAAVVRWGSRVTPLGTSDAELPPTDADALELIEPNLVFFGRPEPAASDEGSA